MSAAVQMKNTRGLGEGKRIVERNSERVRHVSKEKQRHGTDKPRQLGTDQILDSSAVLKVRLGTKRKGQRKWPKQRRYDPGSTNNERKKENRGGKTRTGMGGMTKLLQTLISERIT